MGTRHLTVVQQDNTIKVAQYGQWDGYPTGQGKTIVLFLRTANMDQFRERVAAARFIDDDTLQARWKEAGADDSGWVSLVVSERMQELYPQLSRNYATAGARVLQLIHDRPPGIELRNDIEFAADSLFCEWAYVVNLDTNTLEIYIGFNKKPVPEGERFASLEPVHNGYYPVRLLATYPFDQLPDDDELRRLETTEDEET